MKKIYLMFSGICFSAIAFCQPYWEFPCVPIFPPDTSLVSPVNRRVWSMQKTYTPIVIDGVTDAVWDQIESKDIDRYIMCRTVLNVYSCEPNGNRTPDNKDDFSGSCKLTYDEDFLYILYDVTDNEINDGVINPGITELLEVVEAPYPDSAQQMLKGNPYPPYSGTCPDANKKFAYWAYLGAFKIGFFLKSEPGVDIHFDERADAPKINYPQRVQSCDAKWKRKGDGSGYVLEAAISFKVAMADSADNPYTLPLCGVTFMAFDMFMFDKDNGMNQIKASWNAQDDIAWDAMLYAGKLRFFVDCGDLKSTNINSFNFYPNPVSEIITFTQKVSKVEIYSITGVLMISEQNTDQLNVSDLAQGLYIVKADGVVAGKMVKE